MAASVLRMRGELHIGATLLAPIQICPGGQFSVGVNNRRGSVDTSFLVNKVLGDFAVCCVPHC